MTSFVKRYISDQLEQRIFFVKYIFLFMHTYKKRLCTDYFAFTMVGIREKTAANKGFNVLFGIIK